MTRRQRNYSIRFRWTAFLLCLVLCMESIPMQALALETKDVTANSGLEDKSAAEAAAGGVSESAGAAEELMAGGQAEEDISQDLSGDKADGGNMSEDTSGGNADGEHMSQDTSGDNTDGEHMSEDTSDDDAGDGNMPEDTAGDDAGGGNMPKDTDADDEGTVSGNALASVSDNSPEAVSDNSLHAEKQEMIRSAAKAFDKLLADKDLMALLYHTDSYGARAEAAKESAVAATLQIGQTLYIKGIVITADDVWYRVQYWLDGAEGAGYVQSCYLAYSDEDWIAWEAEYLIPILEADADYGRTAYGMTAASMSPYAVDNSDIAAFPGSYQSALRSLKSAHPNWTFVPMNTGLDFNASVSGEMGDKSLIQKTTNNSANGWVGAVCPSESGWYYATKSAVAYHMDPRNFLTETHIFQFEQLTFNSSYHTVSAVQSFLDGTFMKGKLADDSAGRTYAEAFHEIGEKRKLSPIHLASRVYQEQGQGNSGLISGTYPGYEGYYNFFNVGVNGASTAEKIVKGLTYAKEKGWNTRYKSLEGGAATIGNNYILKYQDTIYLEKFNVDRNSPYGVYNHQYMQNIQAPASESSSTRKMYANAGSLSSAFVFKIPVFTNMPEDEYYPVLSLNKTSLTLDKNSDSDRVEGQRLRLYADGIELEASEAEWKSSDESVAVVENGLVKAVDAGGAVITASYEGVEVSCRVTVKISLLGITLDQTELRLRRPDTVVEDTTGLSDEEKAENIDHAILQVSFAPEDTTADRTIQWSSSNAKVVKVQADPEDPTRAVVTAVGKGEAAITAKAAKAGNKTAVCRVYVSAPIYRIWVTNPNVVDPDEDADAGRPGKTTLLRGQSANLAAEIWPKDTTSDTQIIWSTSDPEIATVQNGRVEAVGADAEGKGAVITARAAGCEQGYAAQHIVYVEDCTVTFLKRDGKTVVKKQSVRYGDTLPKEAFPTEEEATGEEAADEKETDSLFIGWYTGQSGTGSRFDENTVIHSQQTILFPYYEEQGRGFYVLPVGDQTYTGSAVKPTVQVYDSVSYADGSRELIELTLNKDYTVSYKNNRKVNVEGGAVPTITVKGKGNYSGKEYAQFNIVPKLLTDTDITADNITAAYNGKTIKSAPVVYRNGKKLVKNTDYTVSYPQTGTGAYQAAGTYPIIITGKGGYGGRITVHEIITREVLMSKVSIAKIPNQTYLSDLVDKEQGVGIAPDALQVTYKKQPLVESRDGGLTGDYTVTYSNNTAVGTAKATITAVKGSGFTGSKSISYKIVGTSIARAKVEGVAGREYTGSEEDARQPKYTLTLGGRELVESKDGGLTGDYLVTYKNTAKAGTATVIFRGINEYTGQIKKTYKITAYDISLDEDGSNAAITMQYCTQDAPEELKPVAAVSGSATVSGNTTVLGGAMFSSITTPYVKGGSKPTVLLYFHDSALTAGKDYTVKYANNNALTPTDPEEWNERKLPKLTITGRGNFKGSIVAYYTITDGRMAQDNGKLTMTAKDVVFQDKKGAYKSTITITDCNGAKLTAGKDYDRNLTYTYCAADTKQNSDGSVISAKSGVSMGEADIYAGEEGTLTGKADIYAGEAGTLTGEENRPVGEADIPEVGTLIRVTARGIGMYAGNGNGTAELSATYRIVAADISRAKVTAQAQEYRNGQELTLTPEDLKVTMGGNPEPLVYGVDYEIVADTYANNRNKGKASVRIKGLGNYGGEKKITYTIGSKALVWWKNLLL